MKLVLSPLTLLAASTSISSGALIITGVTDGDLAGGNPKTVILTATAAVPDLSIYGIGSTNNGGGTDGEEFTLPPGSATIGDVFVLTGNSDSTAFYESNFVGASVLQASAANINGDDGIELFESGVIIDTFGDANVDGTGEAWEYSDGFANRTGGSAGVFDIANYDVQTDAFDGLSEAEHVTLIENTFGLTAIPEPSTALLGGIALLGLLRRRR